MFLAARGDRSATAGERMGVAKARLRFSKRDLAASSSRASLAATALVSSKAASVACKV